MKPKDNPFAVHRIDAVEYLFDDTDWENVLTKLNTLNYRAVILGQHGSGKTTFLASLDKQLTQQGINTYPLFVNLSSRVLLSEVWQQISQMNSNTVILFDGADLLPFWSWWRFRWLARHVKGIVATTHKRHLLPVLIETHPDMTLLNRVLDALDIPMTAELEKLSQALFIQHQGNIRHVLLDLYWVYADK